jgi:hypothetical protein
MQMGLPLNPITLTTEQIEELLSKLSKVRHNINNNLAMVVAATELIKVNSDMVPRMTNTLMEQPPKIAEELSRFSAEIDRILGIVRN